MRTMVIALLAALIACVWLWLTSPPQPAAVEGLREQIQLRKELGLLRD